MRQDKTKTNLIERLEKATGPDRELDAEIHAAVYGGMPSQRAPYAWMRSYGVAFVFHDEVNGAASNKDAHAKEYTASIDAALSLVLEGWFATIHTGGIYTDGILVKPHVELSQPIQTEFGAGIGVRAQAKAATPAIALCIAALKVRQ